MKLIRKAIAIIALTTVCVVNARADNERNGTTLREQARAVQIEQTMQRREQARGTEERRAMRIEQQVVADSRGTQREEPRRAARMSPEERRALRRQINEASHEIYSPSH